MIEGFENITYNLTEYEMDTVLPAMIRGLERHVGKSQAITSGKMIEGITAKGIKVTPARIRKVVHYIRAHDLIKGLVSSSKGYYIATETKDLSRYIRSLEQRETAIRTIRKKLNQELQNRINRSQSKMTL